MSKLERKGYDKAFKLMAAEFCLTGKPAGTVAKELGVGIDMVRRWAREHNEAGSHSFPGNGKQDLTPEQKEIQMLKKALQEAELENRILKKAVSIFSKDDNKYSGS